MENSNELLKKYSDLMLLKDYSYNSQKNYQYCLTRFLDYISSKEACDIGVSDIDNFINYLIIEKDIPVSSQKEYIAAINLFYREILNKKDIAYSKSIHCQVLAKKDLRYQCIFTKDEVKALIEVNINVKHKVMLSLLYGCALRLHELINIRLTDFDYQNRLIKIYKDNNHKDREIIIPDKLLSILNKYFFEYNTIYWFFESSEGSQYTERSVQSMFHKSLLKTGIEKPASVSALRHSYAVHLYDAGVDMHIIQEILGQYSIKSSKTYTSLSHVNKYKIYNPFNGIILNP